MRPIPRPLRHVDASLALVAVVCSVAVIALFRRGHSSVVTGVFFLLAAGFWLLVAGRVALGASARTRPLVPGVTVSVATTTIMMILLELTLRWGVGTRATYGEANGSRTYRSVYAYDNPTWFHLHPPGSTHVEHKTEFSYTRTINAIGLAERDVPVDKPAGEYRVLALGDSYTEGVGAAYDESWVKVLERRLPALADGRIVKTINAGIMSSDLLFEYVLLRDRLAAYRPDLVIVGLNNSDVADLMVRGGMERFRPDGRVRGTAGPAWDWLYGISYITRHVVHDVLGYTWLLMSPADQEAAQGVARTQLRTALTAMAGVAKGIGARFVVVLHPYQYEVQDGRYEPGLRPLAADLMASQPVETIDLLELYRRDGSLTPANSSDFYWTLDYHHNARGYALMAETLAQEFERRRILPAPAPPAPGRVAMPARLD